MLQRKPAVWTIWMFVLFSFLALPKSYAGFADQVEERTLSNGMKVLLLENHKAPVVTVQVWYHVGSRNESWGKTGLSHMLEHMMFKGTKKVGPEVFSKIIQENGGNDNAFTSADFTAYYTNISADRVRIPLELEADRMANLLLRDEDFKTERMVVMEERRLRTEDNPQAYLAEQLETTAFQIQPYHWPVIGWMADIEGFTLDDLKVHYRTYYNPANAVLVVAGDFRKEALLPEIVRLFSSIPKGASPDQKRASDQQQIGERRVTVKKEAQLPSLLVGYHVPNLTNPDGYVLEVIAGLLAGGKSSRLYRKLVREKELVFSVSADNSLVSHDPNLFSISVDPLPKKEIKEIEAAVYEEIDRLRKEPVADGELQKVKNQVEAAFLYGQDSLFYQGMALGEYEMAHGWRKADDYVPSIEKVTAGDVMRVANLYLISDNRTVAILEPLPPAEGKRPAAGPSGLERITR